MLIYTAGVSIPVHLQFSLSVPSCGLLCQGGGFGPLQTPQYHDISLPSQSGQDGRSSEEHRLSDMSQEEN